MQEQNPHSRGIGWERGKQSLSSCTGRKQDYSTSAILSFIKNVVVFFCVMHLLTRKFPNFSGALGSRYITYIFPTRFSEIRRSRNKQSCSAPFRSNRKALTEKLNCGRPHQTHGPEPQPHNRSPGGLVQGLKWCQQQAPVPRLPVRWDSAAVTQELKTAEQYLQLVRQMVQWLASYFITSRLKTPSDNVWDS